MLGMTSGDTAFVILLTVYGLYCAWAKFCEHRWPKPRPASNSEAK